MIKALTGSPDVTEAEEAPIQWEDMLQVSIPCIVAAL